MMEVVGDGDWDGMWIVEKRHHVRTEVHEPFDSCLTRGYECDLVPLEVSHRHVAPPEPQTQP